MDQAAADAIERAVQELRERLEFLCRRKAAFTLIPHFHGEEGVLRKIDWKQDDKTQFHTRRR